MNKTLFFILGAIASLIVGHLSGDIEPVSANQTCKPCICNLKTNQNTIPKLQKIINNHKLPQKNKIDTKDTTPEILALQNELAELKADNKELFGQTVQWPENAPYELTEKGLYSAIKQGLNELGLVNATFYLECDEFPCIFDIEIPKEDLTDDFVATNAMQVYKNQFKVSSSSYKSTIFNDEGEEDDIVVFGYRGIYYSEEFDDANLQKRMFIRLHPDRMPYLTNFKF